MISFNALLDAATRLDAARWKQQAWMFRAAQHAEGKAFESMVENTWGKTASKDMEPEKPKRGISDLIRDFGGGF